MFDRVIDFFRKKKPQADLVVLSGDHIENLSNHPEVSLSPIAYSEAPLELPIWFDFDPTSSKPAIYDDVFWDVEPMGEYLFYLAGDYKKNEKGFLRFRTAPLEIRAERCFERDVIGAVNRDGLIEQQQAIETHVSLSDLSEMTIDEAIKKFVQAAIDIGYERWVISNLNENIDMVQGRSRLALGYHFFTGVPYLEIIDQRLYPYDDTTPHDSIFQVITWSNNLDLKIGDVLSMHNKIALRYADMSYVPLQGATRM